MKIELAWMICIIDDLQPLLDQSNSVEALLKLVVRKNKDEWMSEDWMISEGKSNVERTKTITLPKLRITLQHMDFLRSTCHPCNKAHPHHPILLTLQFTNCPLRRHHRPQKIIQLRIESVRENAPSM